MHSAASNDEYDVCVIGGGPAGASVASFIAMAGHRVLLLEKEKFPVYKIGESLLPATVHGICAMLGVTDELRHQKFVPKLGGTFSWGRNRDPWTFSFAESTKFQGPTSYAYQVERMKFDAILLNNARKKGVEVREQHRAKELLFGEGRITGVKLVDSLGQERSIKSRYIVDASGHASTFARLGGQRLYSQFFRNIAIFSYFDNAARLPAPNAGNIFCCAFDKGWIWFIPLNESLTSVGAVIGEEYASLLHEDHGSALLELLRSCQPIRTLLSHSTRSSTPPYNTVRVRKDYSYSNDSLWRPGLALIGDAACFIDPLFSSGVHLATYSGLLAARSINSCLMERLDEETSFREFERRYRREYRYFYDFLIAFYDLDQDLDSYYWKARALMNTEENGNHAFLNLVGGYSNGEVLGDFALQLTKQTELGRQLFPGAAKATNVTQKFERSTEAKQFWKDLNRENFHLQMRGALEDKPFHEKALFSDGLVPSEDGLHWVHP